MVLLLRTVVAIFRLSLAMKTYQVNTTDNDNQNNLMVCQHCYEQFASLASKLQQADEQKRRTLDASTRKQRSVQKAFDKVCKHSTVLYLVK